MIAFIHVPSKQKKKKSKKGEGDIQREHLSSVKQNNLILFPMFPDRKLAFLRAHLCHKVTQFHLLKI